MIWRTTMDNLLEALAKSLNISIDGISELLGSIKDNTPQLYEQIVREWVYYNVLSKATMSFTAIGVILIIATIVFRFTLEVDINYLDYKDVPENMSMLKYVKMSTQENVHNAKNTFKMLFMGISVCVILAIVFNISKYLLAPNYSFILNEILPILEHK